MIFTNKLRLIISILMLFLLNNAYAKFMNLDDALIKYQEQKPKIPHPEPDGRVQTLNKKGAMSPILDELTLSFLDFGKNKKVLEIGGAYGFVMSQMLSRNPKTIYHINDLNEQHLLIAAHSISNSNLEYNTLKNLKFIHEDVLKLDINEKYDAILISRVLHFMSPENLNLVVNKLNGLLKSGGRVYVIAITPYVKRYEKFINEYESRIKAGNYEYPGYVDSLRKWLNVEATSSSQISAISDDPFMFLDESVITKLFSRHGFKIISCKTMPLGYESESWSLDGRENVILIAEKI